MRVVDQVGEAAPVAWWRRPRLLDAACLLLLFVAFFVVNNVADWITAPYWLDEDWVALSTRVPVADLPTITSSTPIGWTLLLRLIPDPDALRLLPLAFSLLSLAAAYALGRLLPWRTRAESVLAGLACSGAVLLLPAQQLRHDLKQYTADAAVTLLFLALAAWLDRGWSRRRLGVVVAAVPVGFLLSQITIIVAAGTFAGLLVAAALRRDRRRMVEAVVAGAVSLAVLGLLYTVLVAPHRNAALTEYWHGYYPSLSGLPGYVQRRLRALGPSLGYRHQLLLLGLLFAGLVVLAVKRRAATLAALVVIPVVAAVLGVARAYPLLEERLSYFLFVAAAAVAGIAVVGIGAGIARVAARGRAPAWSSLLAAVLVLAAAASYAVDNREWYRYTGHNPAVPNYSPIAVSDVRTQSRWVATHRRPGDVVVISTEARFGYAFYHDSRRLVWSKAPTSVGWLPVPPDDPDVVVVQGSDPRQISAAVAGAVDRARRNGPGSRLLLVRTWFGGEAEAWHAALQGYRVTDAYPGVEPVAIVAFD
jgi:hypothetical protein